MCKFGLGVGTRFAHCLRFVDGSGKRSPEEWNEHHEIKPRVLKQNRQNELGADWLCPCLGKLCTELLLGLALLNIPLKFSVDITMPLEIIT